ncbi:hypothetical protein chiPu_0025897 [Chiloscyllium punctatum]|uniref:Uncharacterized protein n=1 Tax=Chiloscyllium punctatum TaxID=137246 RepID=A0A401TGI8_CHIPU|nr:hypothetical protein [Chiloscyllium punctatum]
MRGLEKAQWGLETGPTTIWIMDLVRPEEWDRCGLDFGPGAVWILSLVWCGDWAWCCVVTGPRELGRLGRYSQLTSSGTVWRLGLVQPGDWAHYGLQAEHGVARRLWSEQSGVLPWCGVETVPCPVCT